MKKLEPIVKEVPDDCLTTCIDLLYENNSINYSDCKFLKMESAATTASKAIVTITSPGLDKLVLGFKEKEIKINNITDKLKKDIVNTILPSNHYKIFENKLSNGLNYSLPKLKKHNEICKIDLFTKKGTVKIGDIKYEINNFSNIKKHIKVSTSKLLTFSIIKMNINTNISNFTIDDYAKFRNKLNKKEIANKIKGNKNKGIIGDLDILKSIGNIKYIENKKDYMMLDTVIYSAIYNRGKIIIEFNPKFAEGLKQFYMFIPKELAVIDEKEFPHTWFIGYYIYEQARINTKCNFELSIKSCLERTTIPTVKEVEKGNRNYTDRIKEPFCKTINKLTKTITDLNIEYKKDYKTIEDFLNGKVKITIDNKSIKCNYDELSIKRERRNLEKNKTLKKERKEKAIKLKNEGKNTNEIAKILGLTARTIRNYLN